MKAMKFSKNIESSGKSYLLEIIEDKKHRAFHATLDMHGNPDGIRITLSNLSILETDTETVQKVAKCISRFWDNDQSISQFEKEIQEIGFRRAL